MAGQKRTPRSAYTFAILGVLVLTAAAWVTRGSRRLPGPGIPAPSFSATTLDGVDVTLEDYLGEVILLNVWATWCPPCREEMPSMELLYRHFQERGEDFTILAVSIDAPTGASDAAGNVGGDLRAFAREYGLTFPIPHDPSGEIQKIYYTTGVPESFLIGRDGVISYRMAGATDWNTPERRALVERNLAAPPETGPTESSDEGNSTASAGTEHP